ncbi:ATP-binding protein [Streptomyces scabiei]|uniref:ATP-binding protein n=1 Tax=Streptomyces scabiei TaxID=1930 RepID=UPI00299FDE1E|nr:ATP-binding protein [Streptomyces scabiei]MDX2531543.1 ATP-binding protein [Streptomyces scabiei]MDX2796601.1 ATP-binding protein [Streptomyces scabiei]MDX2856869.1 ATP-binding protein [Streptomyces scabiei]MDX3824611.1 ATP-binding protein [Streptomyces scabiei]
MIAERGTTFATGVMTSSESFALSSSPEDQAILCGFEVDFLPAEIRTAEMRQVTRVQLSQWDLTMLTDDATLVVSELVTNAIKHGQGRSVGLKVRRFTDELRIEVTDGSPTPARLRSVGLADENGRGLFLVAAVAKEWGVSPDGTMTWCSLTIPMRHRDGRSDG